VKVVSDVGVPGQTGGRRVQMGRTGAEAFALASVVAIGIPTPDKAGLPLSPLFPPGT